MGKCTFQDSWLHHPEYRSWIERVPNSIHKFRCRICMKSNELGAGGLGALKSHMKSNLHLSGGSIVSQTVRLDDMFGKKDLNNNRCGKVQSVVDNRPTTSTGSSSTIIDDFVSKDSVKKAEILWTLKTVTGHFSFKSCEDVRDLFKLMFADSVIADRITFSEHKCKYLASFGIYPYFREKFSSKLNGTPYVMLFDESLNDHNQKKQLGVHLRYWDNNKVVTRYYDSTFIGHARASDMLQHFTEFKLNYGDLFQISMDGPNVNWSFYDKFSEYVKTEFNKESTLLNIGSCGLHIVHISFKAGSTKSGWDIEILLRSLYSLFKDSPARREDYETVTGSSIFLMKFCAHRWLDNIPAVERAVEIWTSIQKYVLYVETKLKNSEKPTCKAYVEVKNAASDDVVIPRFYAFLSIAKILRPFLVDFQIDRPLMPFMAPQFFIILRSLMKRFIKGDLMKDADNLSKLLAIDFESSNNYRIHTDIDVGHIAEKKLKELLALKQISERMAMDFRMRVRSFLVAVVVKIKAKSPVRYTVVQNMKCLDPVYLASHPDICKSKFKRILSSLNHCRIVPDKDCDDLRNEFEDFVDMKVAQHKSVFVDFDWKKDRLDCLYYDYMGTDDFSNLWPVVKNLLMLSHGQAAVERGFSVNRQIEEDNLSELSYRALRFICDCVKSVGGVRNVEINTELISYCGSAHSRYKAYIDKNRKQNEDSARAQKRKLEVMKLDEL
ncbi:uncharacterized protein LOC141907086 [Tubulanus polymorphus]|uniref:uncharacterized protein LOC141907086 n=1 Tax=Tubulanus polymorphus TaxID=672921 RepID=UPI003DA6C540